MRRKIELRSERERLENIEKGQITRLSEIMEPEIYETRMIEKINYVDELYSQVFRDLTDEVDSFAESMNESMYIKSQKQL